MGSPRFGLTDPYYQFGAMYKWLCDGKWQVLDENGLVCTKLEKSVDICQRLVKASVDVGVI